MNNSNPELFSTKQIAEQLHTSSKVVLVNAKKCLKNKVFENGKPTYFSKEEVTVIIEQMKTSNPNQSTFTGAVKAVSTDLTPALKIKKAMELMQEGYREEHERLEAENKRLQGFKFDTEKKLANGELVETPFGKVRTAEINGKIYFCGKDVATSLGYSAPSKAICDHCKGVTKMVIPSKGGNQETSLIF